MKALLDHPWSCAVLAWLAWVLLRLWHVTLPVKILSPHYEAHATFAGKPILYAFWHGRQFMLFGYPALRPLVQMASLSRDGSLQARILSRLGFIVVRGSSSKRGKEALTEMARLVRFHHHAALALDGPHGPLHKAKSGAVRLARETGAVIVPLTAQAMNAWTFARAWDRYVLPKPFSPVVVALGEPLIVPAEADPQTLETLRHELEKRLTAQTERVDELCGR